MGRRPSPGTARGLATWHGTRSVTTSVIWRQTVTCTLPNVRTSGRCSQMCSVYVTTFGCISWNGDLFGTHLPPRDRDADRVGPLLGPDGLDGHRLGADLLAERRDLDRHGLRLGPQGAGRAP